MLYPLAGSLITFTYTGSPHMLNLTVDDFELICNPGAVLAADIC